MKAIIIGNRLLVPLILIPLMAVIAAGCGGGRDHDPTILRINIRSNPPDLDPALSNDTSSQKILYGVFEPLTRLDGDLVPLPGSAMSWEHNEDYTRWDFHLRPDDRWHNGEAVRAGDYVYSLKRVLTREMASPRVEALFRLLVGAREYYEAGGLHGDVPLEGVEVINDGVTLRFHLAAPDAMFDVYTSSSPFVPVHRATVEQHGPGWTDRPATFLGNGPFRMTSWASGRMIRIQKVDTYWDADKVFWSSVEFHMVDSDATADAAFRAGDLDIVDLMPTEVDTWRDRPEARFAPGLAIYYIIFNSRLEPFDNREVRLALSRAINRQLITRDITRAGEVPATGIIPSTLAGAREGKTYREVAGDMIGRHDIGESRRLLAEAGYTDANPVPSFTFSYNTAENNKLIAEQLQQMWSRLPISDVRINNMEWGVYLQEARAGRLQVFRMGWVPPPDPMLFLEIFTTGHPNNYAGYSNPEFDNLVERALHERDRERREDYLIEAERLLIERDVAVAPLFVYTFPYLVNAKIEGLDINAMNDMTYIRAIRR